MNFIADETVEAVTLNVVNEFLISDQIFSQSQGGKHKEYLKNTMIWALLFITWVTNNFRIVKCSFCLNCGVILHGRGGLQSIEIPAQIFGINKPLHLYIGTSFTQETIPNTFWD